MIVTEPDQLHALDHIQGVGRSADRSESDDRGRADASPDIGTLANKGSSANRVGNFRDSESDSGM